MKKNQVLSKFLLICTMGPGFAAFAQVNDPTISTAQVKTQKYNGYGLPNTKYRKIKLDMTKRKMKQTEKSATHSEAAAPVTLVPKSSLQPNNTATVATEVKPVTPSGQFLTFNFDYDFGYNTQFEKQPDGKKGEYLQHEFMPALKIGSYKILGDFIYYDDIKDPSSNEWYDSAVIFSRDAWELGKYLKLGPSLGLGLPLKKSSREDNGVKYSIGPTLALALNTKNVGMDRWMINYTLGYSKYATEFTTKPNGDPSPDYRLRQRVNVWFNFTDNFSIKTRFQFDSNYSYQNVVRNNYAHFEVFGYNFTEVFSGYIGHSAGSSVYTITESGDDFLFENDLKFYDPKISEIAVGLTLSF